MKIENGCHPRPRANHRWTLAFSTVLPLEAQGLGLEVHASDLNPVAVLSNKALIEIPPPFAGRAPVNPESRKTLLGEDWHGARGLVEDIRSYGKWMRDEATVIAWLWVRAVTCPNPACGVQMPLTSKWWLSKKKGKEAWVEPAVQYDTTRPTVHFHVQTGREKPQDAPSTGKARTV